MVGLSSGGRASVGLRAAIALIAAIAGGWTAWVGAAGGAGNTSPTTWFAPYVDTTLPPAYPVTNPSEDPAGQTAFGFVVSQTSTDCVPSW
jgi:hypothetical protein